MLLRKPMLLLVGLLPVLAAISQRSYRTASVLSSGAWYRISVKQTGVYKIDIPFLAGLGVNTSNLSSSSIRLFGNGGQMLPESNSGPWTDDLNENAIAVEDGGDGILNGNDFILFYATGPDQWDKDSVNQRFVHHKNIYSDRSYYFLSIGSGGRRVVNAPLVSGSSQTISSFSERYFHELDTVNFLQSGKEWYGEELSELPGRSLARSFPVNLPGILPGSLAQIRSSCVARSVGSGSSFDVRVDNGLVGQISIPPIGTGQFDLFAQELLAIHNASPAQGSLSISYTFHPGSVNAQGWINWFEVFVRRALVIDGGNQLSFRDWASVGSNNGEFVIGGASAATRVWDVTDPLSPQNMQGAAVNSQFRFINNCSRLREYIAFSMGNLLLPDKEGAVANQDLHASGPVQIIIVTHPTLLAQAERLAMIHQRQDGYQTRVVTTQQVFNEFASGSPDPVAIRDFVRMQYDRYRGTADSLRYLLLFGDASYDYRERLVNNTNLVPAWESGLSLDPLATYTSDDFFGLLDDQDDINGSVTGNYLDIGIGRVPARNAEEARNFVDKVEAYRLPAALGPWRNDLTFIADDEDMNLHLQDAETITATAMSTAPVFNQDKIYLDAYRQESGTGGSSYPEVIQAIGSRIYNGTLVWNFTGHGGPRRLTEETILDQDIVNNWNNAGRLPLFITATCDFAPYDNPLINSLGENILLRARTGAIALMTTTRIVFAYSNRIMNDNYVRAALTQDGAGRYKTLGDAVREAKNVTLQASSDMANNRKFTLLGDPALTIAYPRLKVRTTKVNGTGAAQADTLSAKEKVIIEGEVTDANGNLMSGFNGTVFPEVFDKMQTVTTLANDPGSQPATFAVQNSALFKGKATVTNGRFSFSFKVPRDINYQYGKGRISLYAENGVQDGNGFFSNIFVGGIAGGAETDGEGPVIRPYLNDERFVNGGIANGNPVLIVKLADSSGINTTGAGVGHDIVATLDNDNRRYFILNDFYQGGLDSYQQGTVRFQLPELDAGPHTLKIKAWDVLNNSSENVLDFTVAKDEELVISHVLNYPNPFTTKTSFWFEHNKPGQDLDVRLQVFTLTGRIIKVIHKTINTVGNRSSEELEWDGRDEYGDKAGRGVYLYRLSVTAPGRLKKEKIEKLVIF